MVLSCEVPPRLVQQILLLDDASLLEPMMPFVRCLNSFILNKRGWLKRDTVAYRASRMDEQQAAAIREGEQPVAVY